MKTDKCLGIWMDYSKAHLMELLPGNMQTQTIESAFTHEVKAESIDKVKNTCIIRRRENI